jgi:hypothetical protein
MKNILFILFFFTTFSGFSQNLNSPSSIIYDSINHRYIVLNDGDNSLTSISLNKEQSFIQSFDENIIDIALNNEYYFVAIDNRIAIYDVINDQFVKDVVIAENPTINAICEAGGELLYVADGRNNVLYKVNISTEEVQINNNIIEFSGVSDLYFDKYQDRILFCIDEANAPIGQIDPETSQIEILIESFETSLNGIAADASGNIYVASYLSHQIWKFNSNDDYSMYEFRKGVEGPCKLEINDQTGVLAIPAKDANRIEFQSLKNIPVYFEETNIITFNGPSSIELVDMDYDGFEDILAASSGTGGVAWFKNNGTDQSSWEKHEIDPTLNNALYAYPGFINQDTLIDVVAVSMINNEISWYENLGNSTVPWAKHLINDEFESAHEVMLKDIDQNGTQDILAAAAGGIVGLWLNDGADSITWSYIPIDENAPGARSIAADDVDKDGDIDIVAASLDSHELTWYENRNGVFYEITIDAALLGAHRVMLSDMDNDDDLDICAVGVGNKNLFWYENIIAEKVIWVKHTIEDNFGPKLMIHPVDLNNDGQKDLVTTAWGAGDVKWFRNVGYDNEPHWNSEDLNLNFPRAWPVQTCDFDKDGDIDIVAGSFSSNKIKLWRNTLNDSSNHKPKAIISQSAKSTNVGGKINFQSNSLGEIENQTWIFDEGDELQTATGSGPHAISFETYGLKHISLIVDGANGMDTANTTVFVDSTLYFEVLPKLPIKVCVGDSIILYTHGLDSVYWEPHNFLNATNGNAVVCTPVEDVTYTITGFSGASSFQLTHSVSTTLVENDNIENAQLLSIGEYTNLTNECASKEESEPVPPLTGCTGQQSWCNEGGVQHSVWYKFEAPQSGKVKITCSGFDSQIALYNAETAQDLLDGNYDLLYANDDINAQGESEITEAVNLVPGKIYWLQVDGSSNGLVGVYSISIEELATIDKADQLNFKIYPNPNRGEFRVETNTPGVLSVFNSAGKLLFKVNASEQSSLNLEHYSKGIYFCRLSTSDFTQTQKLIIH